MKTRPMSTLPAFLACALFAGAMLAGCQSSSGNPTPANKPNFKYGRGDGQTLASAVEIRTRSETDGGIMIRNWIKSNYPGYTITEQELMEQREKAYNMITIIGPNNTSQRVYFDISAYYRRIDRDTSPIPK